MIHKEIQELIKNGKLKMFLQAGVIPVKIKFYYEIYKDYVKEYSVLEKEKGGKMQAITNVTINQKVCEKTVYKAINLMTAKA